MTKLLLLGAGNIGKAIAHLLASEGGYQLVVADQEEKLLEDVPDEQAEKRIFDVRDERALNAALREVDAVLSACPYYLNVQIATAAAAHEVHYFDLTEDVETTRAVRLLAERAHSLLVPQCGLAPGFVSIAAYDLAKRFDHLSRVRMRVGALPQYPSNALKYNLTWSTDGLINEYCNPCEVILDGRYREVLPLEGHEQFSLDGVTYEAFNTSGGLGTLCETLQGKVDQLNYKTVRYPGHCDLIRFLANDLRLGKRRDVFRDVLENAVPITVQDVVLIFVTASGTRNGRLTQETYTKKVYHGEVHGKQLAAIQITTAAAACVLVDLMAEGKLPDKGFLKQEDVSLEDFLNNRFGRYYST